MTRKQRREKFLMSAEKRAILRDRELVLATFKKAITLIDETIRQINDTKIGGVG